MSAKNEQSEFESANSEELRERSEAIRVIVIKIKNKSKREERAKRVREREYRRIARAKRSNSLSLFIDFFRAIYVIFVGASRLDCAQLTLLNACPQMLKHLGAFVK